MMSRENRDDGPMDAVISRRGLFRTGAALAVAAASPLLTDPASAQPRLQGGEDGGTLEAVWRQAVDSKQRIHIKGGTVVSLDPKVGDFVTGDVLIEGKKIAAVGANLKTPEGAQVID